MRIRVATVDDTLHPIGEHGRVLAKRERATLAAIAASFNVSTAVMVSTDRIVSNVDRFLARGRSQRAWRIRWLLRLVEYLPVLSTGRPLTALGPELRQQLIRRKFQSSRGLWWIAAKSRYLVLLGIYGDSSVELETGSVPALERRRYGQAVRKTGGGRPEPGAENRS